MQLRFTSLTVTSSREDLHLQECAHAGRTRKTGCSLVDCNPLIFMVGVAGFELATPCTPCKCATRLRYTPKPSIISADRTQIVSKARISCNSR